MTSWPIFRLLLFAKSRHSQLQQNFARAPVSITHVKYCHALPFIFHNRDMIDMSLSEATENHSLMMMQHENINGDS